MKYSVRYFSNTTLKSKTNWQVEKYIYINKHNKSHKSMVQQLEPTKMATKKVTMRK
jgi:hypothetical protein